MECDFCSNRYGIHRSKRVDCADKREATLIKFHPIFGVNEDYLLEYSQKNLFHTIRSFRSNLVEKVRSFNQCREKVLARFQLGKLSLGTGCPQKLKTFQDMISATSTC